MRLKLMLFVIGLFLITSCTYESGKQVTYIVDEKQPVTFVVEHDNQFAWLQETSEKRNELNKIRALRDYEDNLEEFEFKSRFKNVKRSIDGEMIIGYDQELDNPDFKEVDSDNDY